MSFHRQLASHFLKSAAVFTFAAFTVILTTASSQAQEPQKLVFETPQPKKNPLFDAVAENAKLPRVLLIGDSISMGYTVPVRKLLDGKANVQRVPENGGPTIRGVAKLDQWLGDKKWDVIHFNFGLHDIRYPNDVKPDSPLYKHQVSAADYEKNLENIVERLQKTGAALIWRNTTPVPEGSRLRVPGDEVEYNKIAEKIMKKHGIPIQDLYSVVIPKTAEWQRPKDVHFNNVGNDALGELVAAEIEKAFPKAKAN